MVYNPHSFQENVANFKLALINSDVCLKYSVYFSLAKTNEEIILIWHKIIKEKKCSRKLLKKIQKVGIANNVQLSLDETKFERFFRTCTQFVKRH